MTNSNQSNPSIWDRLNSPVTVISGLLGIICSVVTLVFAFFDQQTAKFIFGSIACISFCIAFYYLIAPKLATRNIVAIVVASFFPVIAFITLLWLYLHSISPLANPNPTSIAVVATQAPSVTMVARPTSLGTALIPTDVLSAPTTRSDVPTVAVNKGIAPTATLTCAASQPSLPTDKTYYERGIQSYNDGEFGCAYSDFNTIIARNQSTPAAGIAYYYLGLIYFDKVKDHPKASEAFMRSIELKPNDAVVGTSFFYLGILTYEQGRDDEHLTKVINYLNTAIEIHKSIKVDTNVSVIGKSYWYRGLAYKGLNNNEAALRDFCNGHAIAPETTTKQYIQNEIDSLGKTCV